MSFWFHVFLNLFLFFPEQAGIQHCRKESKLIDVFVEKILWTQFLSVEKLNAQGTWLAVILIPTDAQM